MSFTADASEALLSVTDLKNYVYCPRTVYFHRVLHLEPRLEAQQDESLKQHEALEEREVKRLGAVFYDPSIRRAEKMFRVPLTSSVLRLQGSVDMLIKAEAEYIPVDFKMANSNRGKIWPDHRYQLVAYSLMVEEGFNATVRRGFVYYVPEKAALRLEVTPRLKAFVKRLANDLWSMVKRGELPKVRVPLRRCSGGCGFLWVCRRTG